MYIIIRCNVINIDPHSAPPVLCHQTYTTIGKDYSKLENELQMLEDCHNDNIVAHYGAFMKVKTMWIAMEFCGGGSVSDRMDSLDRALSEPEIVCVMFHLLQGLTYLHKSHILHRDIRSKNILLTDRGVVKLANFQKKAGLLTSFKLAQETPIIVDTPYWIGPEVVAGGGDGDVIGGHS